MSGQSPARAGAGRLLAGLGATVGAVVWAPRACARRLPTSVPRPPSFSHRGARLNQGSGAELRQAVEGLAKEAGTTPYAVCLLALAVLVARHTGQHDVLIGSPFSGRPNRESEDVIGFFTNTAAMRVSLGDDRAPSRVLGDLDGQVQEALEHQHVAFNDVVRAVEARAGASGRPLVQVVLAHQGPLRPPAGLTGTDAVPWLVDNGTAKADLTIKINEVEDEDELVVLLPYSTDVLDRSTAQRMPDEYVGILREVTSEPERPVRLSARAEQPVGAAGA
ncbi:condensation domain-containing protein [Streptomyces sp. RerS4]|uniref:condensation domain-containing protein n=1 Tax=Streptomyces sp. RerS4 TaxID=2942449 RepID=UPI00201C0D92|nr:condensation domain-containing protein [Streptomyces sp. RerS4]UQW99526.1 condensation domain-containing protein [Streptomyces sp. RerS4]